MPYHFIMQFYPEIVSYNPTLNISYEKIFCGFICLLMCLYVCLLPKVQNLMKFPIIDRFPKFEASQHYTTIFHLKG